MSRKIIILHPSEIIRKGLASILRNYFNIEIIQLANPNDIIALQDISNALMIIYFDSEILANTNYINSLISKNNLKVIGISDNPDQDKFHFDNIINLDTPPSEIHTIVENCMSTNDKPTNEKEGEDLSIREREVLKLVASGYSNKKIAETLFISVHTVISHRKNITEKTGIKSISGLTVYAILNNLIDTENLNPEDLI